MEVKLDGDIYRAYCEKCDSEMVVDDSTMYTSMPPSWGYSCSNCDWLEFSTVYYPQQQTITQNDNQKPRLIVIEDIYGKYAIDINTILRVAYHYCPYENEQFGVIIKTSSDDINLYLRFNNKEDTELAFDKLVNSVNSNKQS